MIRSKVYKRLYIKIHDLSMFAYFEEGVARLRNLPIKKVESFEIQIIDTDECLEDSVLRYKVISAAHICELIFKGSLPFWKILILNKA